MLFRRMLFLVLILSFTLIATSCEEDVTGPDGDETPPLVTSAFPLPNATNVPVDADMTIQFDEAMEALSPALMLGYVTLSHGTVSSVAWTNESLLTISHTTWPEATTITATFSAAFVDTSGNTMSGSYSYSFTTVEMAVTGPTVIMTYPANGEDRVWAGEAIWVTFSEAMDPTTKTSDVSLSHGPITDIYWPQPHVMEIHHDDWPASTEITLTLGTGLMNAGGEHMSAEHVVMFTTDTNTVSLEQHVPGNGDTDVPRNVDVWLEFSRGMDAVSLESAITVSVPDKADIVFDLVGEWEDWTLQFPTDLPATTQVTINIDSSAQDQYGQPLDQVYEFSFTTGATVDLTPPQLLSTVPANGAAVPATTGLMQFTFDEAIDDFSLNPTVVSGQFAMNMWASEFEPEWNADRTVISVVLTTPLAAGTTFMVEFESFADISGNVNTDGFTYQFTVDGDPDYYPVIHGQWSGFMGHEESNEPVKYTGEVYLFEQIEVIGGVGDFLVKEWDFRERTFNNWDMMTRNTGGIIFRGFHETDWDTQESFDIMFDPVIEWMRFPVTAQNWAGTSMLSSPEPGGADRVEFAVEQVDGTFDVLVETPNDDPSLFTKESGPGSDILWMECRKSILHYELTDGLTTFNSGNDTLYYAPGVGLVREVSYEEETGGFWRSTELNLMWIGDHLPDDR